ncbi:MAG: DUF481 domain-containing protein [Pirellulales bacterium]|nr:DUF481 domain-containing protein [Pirellulales bacterium]
MKTLALHCVTVCTFGWAGLCAGQWPGEAPVVDLTQPGSLPNIERLPPISIPDLPPPPDAAPVLPSQDPPETEPELAEGAELETPLEEVTEEVVVESPWSGSFELGLNGSDGNSDVFNFRFGVDLKRETDWTTFTFDLDYKNDSTDDVQTVNRLFLDAREEWSPTQGRWNLYLHGTTEYDEFKDFDSRIAADAGLTYNFVKTDVTRFAGRVGLGTSKEFGSVNDDWIPEGSFGLDFERQISKLQKFVMSVDYFPDLSDFGDCRIDTKADYEIVIDADMNLSLKLGALNRYDSTPGDSLHNDLDYSAVLLWNF